MNRCGSCQEWSRDGIGCPEDHDTYGHCWTHNKCIEPDESVCEKFVSRETVTMPYNTYLNVLVELNKAINACTKGHGNNYMWRALGDIEANLSSIYKNKDKLFKDIGEKTYGKDFKLI